MCLFFIKCFFITRLQCCSVCSTMHVVLLFVAIVSYIRADHVDIPLSVSGYSYAAIIDIDDKEYNVVLDTASNKILYGENITEYTLLDDNCLSLSVDESFANFTVANATCVSSQVLFSMQNTSNASVKVQFFDSRSIANANLHDWSTTAGVLGMSYPTCDESTFCKDTSFQTYLSSFDTPNFNSGIIGLDLNRYNGSLQLGGVSSDYANLMWSSPQATEYPSYHETFLYNLQICDRQLQSNWSHTYDVVVDTASACVSLPKEFYDSFAAWFNTSVHLTITPENEHLSDYEILTSHDILPLLSFSLHESSPLLHVSLADLLVNSSDIESEDGAPMLYIYRNDTFSSIYRVCILRGESLVHISSEKSNHVYNNPPVVLGSLALRSIYFAANYQTRQIGFANKRTYSNPTAQCKTLIRCKGEQLTDHSLNQCKEPWCARYFFKVYDEDAGICHYDMGAVVVGFIFIIVIIVMEICSYFIGEYCSQHLSSPTNANPSTDHKLDPITASIAPVIVGIVDVFLIYICQWAPVPNNRRAVTPQNSETGREERWVPVSVSQHEHEERVLSLAEGNTSTTWT